MAPDSASAAWRSFVWQNDRMQLDDLVFLTGDDGQCPAGDYFNLYKGRALLDEYAGLLARIDLRARNVVELGIWDGGSAALWFEVLQPDKLVAVDLSARGDSDYFRRYVASRHLEKRLRTYWGVDQSDRRRLQSILAAECSGPLDLVIDDASHLYEPTKASFEALFPRLRPGGLYIIEDWCWEHAERFQRPDHHWADKESLTKLVVELVEVTGTQQLGTIKSLTVFGAFVVVERGGMIDAADPFILDDRISRRAPRSE